jgi:hypothetical protein
VEADFAEVRARDRNYTTVTLRILPRAITDRSCITLTGMKAGAKARLGERLNPLGTWRDREVRGRVAGRNSRRRNPRCRRRMRTGGRDGRRSAIERAAADGDHAQGREDHGGADDAQVRMDIDAVRGRATLDLKDGTKQGYTRDFVVEA